MFSVKAGFNDLYRAAKGAHPAARAELILRYQTELKDWIRRRLGYAAQDRWEDVLQDTLCEILRCLPRYPDELKECEFRSYLFQTAKFFSLRTFRSRMCTTGTPLDALAGRELNPLLALEYCEGTQQWIARVNALGRQQASVLFSLACLGRSIPETARALDVSVQAVRKRRSRGRARLRALLGRLPS